MTKPKKVSIDQSTLDFYMAEADAINALCDRAAVPQHIDGEPLSMSQRVAILEGVQRGLLKRIGEKPTRIH